jgi:hypothetical protein
MDALGSSVTSGSSNWLSMRAQLAAGGATSCQHTLTLPALPHYLRGSALLTSIAGHADTVADKYHALNVAVLFAP